MGLIALTGGSGFVGAAVIEELLSQGDSIRVLARAPEKLRRWGGRIEIVEGALTDETALAQLAAGADGMINCAGLTHALSADAFTRTNVEGAAMAAAAARAAGAKFVHISSMAARQPELSAYARSKRESEDAVRAASRDNPVVSLRAPAIYGPGDEATLPYFRLVRRGLAPEPSARPAPRASILYVGDVARAVTAAYRAPLANGVFDLNDETSDGRTWAELGQALGKALGSSPARLRVPRFVLNLSADLASAAARVSGKPTFVTRGKIAEFFHPDWVARDNCLSQHTHWRAETPLDVGFAKTARWYQEQGLL